MVRRRLRVPVRYPARVKALVCGPLYPSRRLELRSGLVEWCCNQEYERCTQKKNQIKVCYTVFASGNANVSIAEANTVESSSTSTSTTSSATPLGSVSWTLSSKANAGSASTTSATIPLDTDSSSSTTSSSKCLRLDSV